MDIVTSARAEHLKYVRIRVNCRFGRADVDLLLAKYTGDEWQAYELLFVRRRDVKFGHRVLQKGLYALFDFVSLRG